MKRDEISIRFAQRTIRYATDTEKTANILEEGGRGTPARVCQESLKSNGRHQLNEKKERTKKQLCTLVSRVNISLMCTIAWSIATSHCNILLISGISHAESLLQSQTEPRYISAVASQQEGPGFDLQAWDLSLRGLRSFCLCLHGFSLGSPASCHGPIPCA